MDVKNLYCDERGNSRILLVPTDRGVEVWTRAKIFPTAESWDAIQRYCETLIRRIDQKAGPATTMTVSRQMSEISGDLPIVQDLVVLDVARRRQHGMDKYGVPLQPFDGNDPIVEAYGEILDLANYLRQEIYERLGI